MATDAGEGRQGFREHFRQAHDQERLRNGAHRVRILYQQLAATAEVGSPEQGDYERGVHRPTDPPARPLRTPEPPRPPKPPRPCGLTTWSTRLTPARRGGRCAPRDDRPGSAR
ncbi:hypothetical protein [Nocardiopsis metallicus]|uniref:Uncharacterized protein n=1 Tax=Nocardiopsis metallicus TaxID=179819 RepID=A0A840WE30_9ACTN|nr:hypothetical protein [Nocardiopsis metallicus]MBB5495250.1 hypothetical protein [Nocardiopsis metallicus]